MLGVEDAWARGGKGKGKSGGFNGPEGSRVREGAELLLNRVTRSQPSCQHSGR